MVFKINNMTNDTINLHEALKRSAKSANDLCFALEQIAKNNLKRYESTIDKQLDELILTRGTKLDNLQIKRYNSYKFRLATFRNDAKISVDLEHSTSLESQDVCEMYRKYVATLFKSKNKYSHGEIVAVHNKSNSTYSHCTIMIVVKE